VKDKKAGRKISCLLVSEYAPDTLKMRESVDSFILANDASGFDHLMAEAI
jgi:hypothetical protein